MHQVIALGVVLAAAFVFHARAAAVMASEGNWGFGVGQLFFAPVMVFFFVHTLAYFLTRLVRGKDKLRSYTRSRINYVGMVVALMGVLGSAATPV